MYYTTVHCPYLYICSSVHVFCVKENQRFIFNLCKLHIWQKVLCSMKHNSVFLNWAPSDFCHLPIDETMGSVLDKWTEDGQIQMTTQTNNKQQHHLALILNSVQSKTWQSSLSFTLYQNQINVSLTKLIPFIYTTGHFTKVTISFAENYSCAELNSMSPRTMKNVCR